VFRKESGLLERNYRNERPIVFFLAEFDQTIAQREQRVVLTNTHIVTWMMLRASLTNNDVACNGGLSSKYFNAQSLAVRFSTVFGTTDSFFVCHGFLRYMMGYDLILVICNAVNC